LHPIEGNHQMRSVIGHCGRHLHFDKRIPRRRERGQLRKRAVRHSNDGHPPNGARGKKLFDKRWWRIDIEIDELRRLSFDKRLNHKSIPLNEEDAFTVTIALGL
jgi:hypothetical protein